MTIIVDGTIGTVNSLVTTSEDSRGNKLTFKDTNGIYHQLAVMEKNIL